MIYVCYPKCTTCKKAMKWLDDNNISYEVRDIKENNPSYEELLRLAPKKRIAFEEIF